MNILITGYSGFLGKEVVNSFRENKYNLILIGRKKIKKKNYIFCNLKNLKRLKSILNCLEIDAIINLAAEVNFYKKTKDMYKINASCPYEMAKFCKRKDIHFIQASGTIVNGLHKIYSKRTKFNPVNHYGKSKLMGEKLIQKTKCKYSILRFGGIYGKNGPNHLGINKFIKTAQKRKKIVFSGNEKSLRNYIFVKDAAKFILTCLENKKYGIFYVGGEVISFEKMLKHINKTFNKSKNIFFVKKEKIKLDNQIVKTDKLVKFTRFSKSLKLIK